MGKIRFSFLSLLIFFFLSFGTSFATFSFMNAAFAQEMSITPLVIVSPSAEIKKSAEYNLPYPGILPDSPFYIFRALRDKLIGFLISSPLKKAEFNLLQADKRLNSGVYLFNSVKDAKKINLAITTISKAENYFYEAIAEIKMANTQGVNTTSLTEKLLDASKKHQEVIISLEKQSKGNIRESLIRERKRAEDLEKEVMALLSKKAK